jgi:hypothetical protein
MARKRQVTVEPRHDGRCAKTSAASRVPAQLRRIKSRSPTS